MIKKFAKYGIILALVFQFNNSMARSSNYEKVDTSKEMHHQTTQAEWNEAWMHIEKGMDIMEKDRLMVYDEDKMEKGMKEMKKAMEHMKINMSDKEWSDLWMKMKEGMTMVKQSTELPIK